MKDGYLVDFESAECTFKFLDEGIVYDALSEEEKEEYEDLFTDETGHLPERIAASKLNSWVFNEDTIRQVLHEVMEHSIKIDAGTKIGKTIIFAKNHEHAEKIFALFNKWYPHYNGYAKVIDNYTSYAQSAIDEFSRPDKLPQIAISVDMLDTGIDVPEVLNLVFFKKVMSKAKFWQRIGRGTRLCPELLDGEDKQKFLIFDFCGNFEFFRLNPGRSSGAQSALQGSLFVLKSQIVYKLQDIAYQSEGLRVYRAALVDDLVAKVSRLDRAHFAVRQHLRYVESFSKRSSWEALSYEDTLMMKEHVVPLIIPDEDEATALRFDALLYGMELAFLMKESYTRACHDLMDKVRSVAAVANIPEIKAQSDLINKILHSDYVAAADVSDLEHIRQNLRHLMKYISKRSMTYVTDFEDDLMAMEWNESELDSDDLLNYRAKAESYVREHVHEPVIAKLKGNIPLSSADLAGLERILWSELGSKDDYVAEFGDKPLGAFVREIVGLDMNAAKEAFSLYLNDASLDSAQVYFVNQIVEYIVHNGMMEDFAVLKESPFTDRGGVADLFSDLSIWYGIRGVIEKINANVKTSIPA